MDLDDQELFYTLILNKKLKEKDLKRLREEYAKIIQKDREEIRDMLGRINKIDKELGDIER
jgi:CRISPR/Cas system-associated endoribonuclease Cas2